jgi:hypothetical protein
MCIYQATYTRIQKKKKPSHGGATMLRTEQERRLLSPKTSDMERQSFCIHFGEQVSTKIQVKLKILALRLRSIFVNVLTNAAESTSKSTCNRTGICFQVKQLLVTRIYRKNNRQLSSSIGFILLQVAAYIKSHHH